MKLFQEMDLYKVVILGSVLALPASGWWIKTTQDKIGEADRAILAATKPGGYIEEIGTLQQQLQTVEKNRINTKIQQDTSLYFEGQIFASAGSGIDKNAFRIQPPRDEPVQTSQKQLARDYIVRIDWLNRGGKDFAFTMEFLFAVLFNCETGWTTAGNQELPSIWKLYSLKLANDEIDKLASQLRVPPQQAPDQWTISQMEFARREPRKDR